MEPTVMCAMTEARNGRNTWNTMTGVDEAGRRDDRRDILAS
jgi:hypothetical protein